MLLNSCNKIGSAITIFTALLFLQGCSNYSGSFSGKSPRYHDRVERSSRRVSSPRYANSRNSSKAVTTPIQERTEEPTQSESSTENSSETVSSPTTLDVAAHRYIGTPYKFGGTTSRGFDCSGYVWRVYQDMGLNFTRASSASYYDTGERVNRRNARKGDLVFFKTRGRISHVGIYLGDNIFIHSSSSRGVIESSLENSYWKPKVAGFRRFY